MKAKTVLAVAALALGASMASADVLWNQAPDLAQNGFYNSISGAPPFGVTAYVVGDITVPAGGWNVDSITMYFGDIESGGSWQTSVTQGRLYIQPKTGSLPTAAPSGALIPMSATSLFDNTYQQAYYAVTASGLAQVLAAGDYWIGITPAAPGGFFGPEIGLSSSGVLGSTSADYDAGFPSWAALTTDAAITVNGTAVPAPAGLALLAVGGLAASRRRRA